MSNPNGHSGCRKLTERRLERGCEQASCVLGPIAPQRFGGEREHAVADDGDLDGAELEAVEAGLRLFARFGRMGDGGGGQCGGPDRGGAGTQEGPAVEHEHFCSPFFASGHPKNKPGY